MTTERPGPQPNFDPIARVYRAMEYLTFGSMLERCRFYFLPECGHARRALVLGDGDGRFTARLMQANRDVHVGAVDASAAMLRLLRRRVARTSSDAEERLRTIHADLRAFAATDCEYDLVVSHFFLDCLSQEELDAMVARLEPQMMPEADWLISEFAVPERGWRRAGARGLIRLLYFAFGRLTGLEVKRLPDYARALTAHGFQRRQKARFLGGLLVTEFWRKQ